MLVSPGIFAEAYSGYLLLNVSYVVDASESEILCAEGGQRDRYVLDKFGALLSGDYDLFDASLRGGLRRRSLCRRLWLR